MGILNQVIAWLREAGFSADRGYPGGQMCAIDRCVAAVQLQKMDGATAAVLVNVLAPAASGAAVCEDTAVQVSQILRACDGICAVGQCSYLMDANCFCVPVTAEFTGQETDGVWVPAAEPAEPEKLVFSVTLGNVVLDSAVSFTAQRTADETVTQLDSAAWTFTLEESFPLDGKEAAAPEEPFTIIVSRQERTETYTDCTLTQQKRVLTEDGLQQIRTGVAGSVTVS